MSLTISQVEVDGKEMCQAIIEPDDDYIYEIYKFSNGGHAISRMDRDACIETVDFRSYAETWIPWGTWEEIMTLDLKNEMMLNINFPSYDSWIVFRKTTLTLPVRRDSEL